MTRGFRVPVVLAHGGSTRVMRLPTGGRTDTKGWVVTVVVFDGVEAGVWFQRVSGDTQGTEMIAERV